MLKDYKINIKRQLQTTQANQTRQLATVYIFYFLAINFKTIKLTR